jgi:hypothetical protein
MKLIYIFVDTIRKKMETPRNYTEAKRMGWTTKRVSDYNGGKIRVDLSPRFYNGGKAIISFWLTYTGCKRLGIKFY